MIPPIKFGGSQRLLGRKPDAFLCRGRLHCVLINPVLVIPQVGPAFGCRQAHCPGVDVLTDEAIVAPQHKGGGSDLDYKVERHKFEKATDGEKSELLKDILAFANAYRDGPAYILVGFKEVPPNPAQVVGLSDTGAIDDCSNHKRAACMLGHQTSSDLRRSTAIVHVVEGHQRRLNQRLGVGHSVFVQR